MEHETNEQEIPGRNGYRAPEGEGIASDDPSQMSLYDGAGNEIVVVLAENEDGRRAQGTGATAEEARADARTGSSLLGDGFGTAQ